MDKKIRKWHIAVVQGLNNGLTHTIKDGRRDDIKWVRQRLRLWEAFGRCVFAFHNKQNWESDEEELFEIAREGYSHKL